MSRICVVCVSLRAGGTERVVSRLADRLSKRHQVTMVLLARSEIFYPLGSEIRVIQPLVKARSESGWRWYPKIVTYLSKSLRQTRPDLVLCFGEAIAPLALCVSSILRKRCIVFNRASPLSALRGLRGLVNPLTYPLAWRVVVQTRRSIEVLERRYRLVRFEVLPNPVDIPAVVPRLEKRSKRIIYVGTLGGKKNQQALIRAFANCENKDEWRLDFAGDGPDRPGLEALVKELNLESKVSFLGQRQDIGNLLVDSRIFAFCSLTEGFPNALAEALAAGCACLSYDCPTGPSELITHGDNGLLVRNGDEVAFSNALSDLVCDASLQQRLATAARVRIRQFADETVFCLFDQLIHNSLPSDSRRAERRCGS